MKLDIGCGLRKKKGFIGMDIIPEADIQHNLLDFPYPFKESSIEEIYCNHVLEHFREDDWMGYNEISDIIKEFMRILKPDGKAIIIVPSPQSQDAIRETHKTVYGYRRLEKIFKRYFKVVKVKGRGTWIQGKLPFRLLGHLLTKIDPFFAEEYLFELKKPRKGER